MKTTTVSFEIPDYDIVVAINSDNTIRIQITNNITCKAYLGTVQDVGVYNGEVLFNILRLFFAKCAYTMEMVNDNIVIDFNGVVGDIIPFACQVVCAHFESETTVTEMLAMHVKKISEIIKSQSEEIQYLRQQSDKILETVATPPAMCDILGIPLGMWVDTQSKQAKRAEKQAAMTNMVHKIIKAEPDAGITSSADFVL
jgi:hypothetical protein